MVSAIYTTTEDQATERRQLAGMRILICHHQEIKRTGQWIYIPSESHPYRWYKTSTKHKICQCPDNSMQGNHCKHLWAAIVWASIMEEDNGY